MLLVNITGNGGKVECFAPKIGNKAISDLNTSVQHYPPDSIQHNKARKKEAYRLEVNE